MIGIDFISFAILLVISIAVSGILHYGLHHYVTPGYWSFASKVAVGYIGAWIGSTVFGKWPQTVAELHHGDIYYIPAIIGAAAIVIVAVDLGHMAFGAPKTSARRRR